jgi:hypothetical protein
MNLSNVEFRVAHEFDSDHHFIFPRFFRTRRIFHGTLIEETSSTGDNACSSIEAECAVVTSPTTILTAPNPLSPHKTQPSPSLTRHFRGGPKTIRRLQSLQHNQSNPRCPA